MSYQVQIPIFRKKTRKVGQHWIAILKKNDLIAVDDAFCALMLGQVGHFSRTPC